MVETSELAHAAEAPQSTPGEAKERAERIRASMVAVVTLPDEVKAAWASRDWVALDYPSWDGYVVGEFGEHRLPMLSRQQRRELVADLREGGLSTRAIGAVVGVAPQTVVNDLAVVQKWTTEPAPQPVEEISSTEPMAEEPVADISAPATMITGANGKPYPSSRPTAPRNQTPEASSERYAEVATGPEDDVIDAEIVDEPAAAPAPERKTNRRPITDAFRDAAYDLIKAVERVERLVDDDRYPRNAEQVAHISRGDLLRAAELLAAVVDRIAKPNKESAL